MLYIDSRLISKGKTLDNLQGVSSALMEWPSIQWFAYLYGGNERILYSLLKLLGGITTAWKSGSGNKVDAIHNICFTKCLTAYRLKRYVELDSMRFHVSIKMKRGSQASTLWIPTVLIFRFSITAKTSESKCPNRRFLFEVLGIGNLIFQSRIINYYDMIFIRNSGGCAVQKVSYKTYLLYSLNISNVSKLESTVLPGCLCHSASL